MSYPIDDDSLSDFCTVSGEELIKQIQQSAPLMGIDPKITLIQNMFDAQEVEAEFEIEVHEPKIGPPKPALLVMYVLYRRESREALLGDMEQDFQEAIELFGHRTAVWLCWKGVIASIGPSVIAWVTRGVIFGKVVEFFHKFVG